MEEGNYCPCSRRCGQKAGLSTACGIATGKQILSHTWVCLCQKREHHPLVSGNIQIVTFFRAIFCRNWVIPAKAESAAHPWSASCPPEESTEMASWFEGLRRFLVPCSVRKKGGCWEVKKCLWVEKSGPLLFKITLKTIQVRTARCLGSPQQLWPNQTQCRVTHGTAFPISYSQEVTKPPPLFRGTLGCLAPLNAFPVASAQRRCFHVLPHPLLHAEGNSWMKSALWSHAEVWQGAHLLFSPWGWDMDMSINTRDISMLWKSLLSCVSIDK